MRRTRLLPAALVLAAFVGGCDSGHGDADRTVTVRAQQPLVAWAEDVPRDFALPSAPAAELCRAASLRVVGGGLHFAATPEGGTGAVTLRNAGTGPCRLTGRPRVRFVGAPRQPEQRQLALPPRPPTFPTLAPRAASLVALPPGREATLSIDWANWCVPGAAGTTKPLVPPRAARITLAGGSSIDAAYDAVTRCERPGEPSTIGVRPFQPSFLPKRPPWTDAAVTARILPFAGGPVPLRGRRGAVTRFVVELRNASRVETVRFAHCPLVAEVLAPAGEQETHILNCRGAHALAPGKAERFEMRIRVPKAAPTGPNGLFWELDPFGWEKPELVARLVVTD